MANVILGNPLILDTVADNIVVPGRNVLIMAIVWDGPTAVNHVVQLENGHEIVIWKKTLTDIVDPTNIFLPASQITFPLPLVSDGLSLGTLDSGTLYVYLARPIA